MAHNVDLEKLSSAQLEELIVDARTASLAKSDESRLKALKKLKDSGELKQMKEEFKASKVAAKELSKAIQFQLNVPITFTITTELDLSEIEYDPQYILSQAMTGTIAKDSGLTAAQLKVLKPVVEEYVEGACSDIFEIVPAEIKSKFKEVEKRFAALYKQAKKQGLDFNDL